MPVFKAKLACFAVREAAVGTCNGERQGLQPGGEIDGSIFFFAESVACSKRFE